MALGGPQAVVPNPEGWEIGVYEVELTEAGKDWFERAQQKGQDRIESSEQVLEHVTETKNIVSQIRWLERCQCRMLISGLDPSPSIFNKW